MDLYIQIEELRKKLQSAIEQLNETGYNYATAYRTYRMLLAEELLRLKNDGMAVTIAYDIARGCEEVANAKFDELTTQAIYKANLENINSIKLQLKILENQYQREWTSPNFD